eukprot:TRINITY_DN518_c0_g1_i7.p2 TRINITY_DN518_c0_g1~~TRINITY_DN518_c0_g1_i7.p2  ORF type:complete len:333 (-),score=149.65 TRINITY_DN518_c0_g1_i7:253-1251(-)
MNDEKWRGKMNDEKKKEERKEGKKEEKKEDVSINQSLLGKNMQGWYCEVNEQWPGTAHCLQVDELLHSQKSDYQDVMVFKSNSFGNVLILDGVIQLTERDEMAYQEMMTHLAMFSHPNPKRVLVVGGGDGGVITQVFKHESVTEVVICEIDQMVMDVSKKYFSKLSDAWSDPRLTVVRGDAAEYMQRPEIKGTFDIIISDTSDPVGPAQPLFEATFYHHMHDALAPGGVICTQAESIWLHLDLINKLVTNARKIFASAEYAVTHIPTYPCGSIGLLVCRKALPADQVTPATCTVPSRPVPESMQPKLSFYNEKLHSAAFVLPTFVQRVLPSN